MNIETAQYKILIADNVAKMAAAAAEFFRSEGYEVVTASSPEEARRILEQDGAINLAILDLRLTDEERSGDISGLILAEETSPAIPKIIWTKFPTFEAVRRALGPAVDRLPPAVGFVDKTEGFHTLLRSVRLALQPPPRILLTSILRAFEVPGILRLPERIKSVGPAEASHRAQEGFEAARKQLAQLRDLDSARASHHHVAGLVAAALGMIVIVAAIVLVRQGTLTSSGLTMVGSLVMNAVSVLFFAREDAAHRRVRQHVNQLEDMYRVGKLLEICDCLESQSDRDAYRMKLIDRMLDKM